MSAPRGAASAAWLMALFWGAAAAHALSLRSTRAEAFLGESPPGGTLSYSRAVGAPLGVENAGGEPAGVELAVAIPPPGELADGYEPLPDPSWVRLEKESFALRPGERGVTDVEVRIPRQAGLAGRQFQFEVRLRGRDGPSLRTRMRLAAGPGEPPDVPAGAPEGFALVPARGRAEAVPLGRPFVPAPGAGGLKLVNAGTREATVMLSTLRAWPEHVSPPEGFSPSPNPRWLMTGPPVKVPAGSIAAAALELRVPDEPRYRGRKWTFLVAADARTGGKTGRSLYLLSVVTEAASKEAGR